jgi:hypothetical protein
MSRGGGQGTPLWGMLADVIPHHQHGNQYHRGRHRRKRKSDNLEARALGQSRCAAPRLRLPFESLDRFGRAHRDCPCPVCMRRIGHYPPGKSTPFDEIWLSPKVTGPRGPQAARMAGRGPTH